MSTLIGPDSDHRPLETLWQVTEAGHRANHLTGPAAWLVTTSGLALALTVADLRALNATAGAALLALLVPGLVAAVRAVLLLARAASAVADVGGEPGWSAGAAAAEPPTDEQLWARLHRATAALQHRELLAERALLWAGAFGGCSAAWIVLTTLVARGHLPGA